MAISKACSGVGTRSFDLSLRPPRTLDGLSRCPILLRPKRFFTQAIEKRGVPEKISLDGYAASHVAVAELQEEGILPTALTVRTNTYLNNVIEQAHPI